MADSKLAPACGIYCGACEHLNRLCSGCGIVEGKPFWTAQSVHEVCPIYQCCNTKKRLEHCGLCPEFPCDTFTSLRDPSLSEEETRRSLLARQHELLRRKEIETDRWLDEKQSR